jgi:hypothetical protein
MKRKIVSWQNLLVVLGVLIPEAVFFWLAHGQKGSIFLFGGLIFGWNFLFLAARFFTVRFVFERKEKFWSHMLTMFLTSNFLFFGYATWVFVDIDSVLYKVLPFLIIGGYAIVWLSQNNLLWEVFTICALTLGITFSWLLVIPLAFPGGVLAIITLYSVYVTAYNWAKIHKLTPMNGLFFATLVALVMSEAGWALLLWPIRLLPLTLVLLGIFYMFGVLLIKSHHQKLTKNFVFSHLTTALVLFIGLCLSTQWKPPIQFQ